MRTKILTIQTFVLFLLSTFLIAQTSKTVIEKLNKIKGEASKVVISTEKGDVVFEGDEAKHLLKSLRSKKLQKKIEWISDKDHDSDSESDNVIIFKSENGGKHIIKEFKGTDNVMILEHGDHDDLSLIEEGKIIKIDIDDKNDEKTVTVTTKENGEEKVEKFTGKEADEYLENMEEDGEMIIDIDVDIDSKGDHVWIHKNGDAERIEKNVRVELEDGVKKVTVTTIEDGKEKVEVYEGNEADEYFESENCNKSKIEIKKLKKGDKKSMKIIKKEISKEKE